jgi:quinol-cytochrome oxidoreductase complex cytochrome b subunit
MSSNITKPWIDTRLPFITAWRAHFLTPNLAPDAPYLGTLPSLITTALVFMALSGFVLSVHYDPAHPFTSLQFIDRNVNNGWLIHAFHETGTTMIFGAVYLTLYRIMVTRAYRAPGEVVWLLTVAQFCLLLLVGYLGYLLDGGAVSYWSLAGVTTAAGNLGGAPGAISNWFFGGPDGPGTLARIAMFHTLLALAIFGIVALHYLAKRAVTAPPPARGQVSFHPYYTAQYFVAFVVFALIFAVLVFFAPHFGENTLNGAPGGPLVVPATVSPPWYLLSITNVSHAFPGMWGGIFGVIARLAVLFALPWLDRSKPDATPGALYRFLVMLLALDILALGLAAAATPSMLTSILAIVFTAWYFLHFLVFTPLVTAMEAK